MLKLSALKASDSERMTRTFWFPPDALPEDRFSVTVNYLSPALFNEKTEAAKIKYAGGRRNRESDVNMAKFRQVLIDEVLIRAVVKIDDLTVGKLRRMIPMDAKAVGECGGLVAIVPADPTIKPDHDKAPKKEDGSAYKPSEIEDAAISNIKFLLTKSNEFFDWIMEVCTNLAYFQDETWEEKVKNSVSGPDTSSEPVSAI